MTSPTKNHAVICNLYIDFVYPETMTQEDATKELSLKLRTFAVLNRDLMVKWIINPKTPTDTESVYLP